MVVSLGSNQNNRPVSRFFVSNKENGNTIGGGVRLNNINCDRSWFLRCIWRREGGRAQRTRLKCFQGKMPKGGDVDETMDDHRSLTLYPGSLIGGAALLFPGEQCQYLL